MAVLDLERQYRSSFHVPDHQQIVAGWPALAAAFRDSTKADMHVQYGAGPRNTMDIFHPAHDAGLPILVFIHGGYWQSLDNSVFSHLARGGVENGVVTVLPTYDLCPDVSISDIIEQVREACAALWRRFRRPLIVAGHSAGGHLSACMLATEWETQSEDLPRNLVKAAFSISGLFDLRPLLQTTVNEKLRLQQAEAVSVSPLFWKAPSGLTLDAIVGGEETAEFHRQSKELVEAWAGAGVEARYGVETHTNHYTVIAPLADPRSHMSIRILDLVRLAVG
jgi:arylformamidase